MSNIKIAAMASTVRAEGDSENSVIEEFFVTCDLIADFGFDAVWLVEHHFTNYHPTPNPLLMLSHASARRPTLGLGTAVLVTPWHQPLRLAGEIALLSHLTNAPIYIGMGRGNAPLEYEAFGVPMGEALDRFSECWQILREAMKGEPFTFEGKHLNVSREIAIRPKPRASQITFFGAIGQPSSAQRIGALGLAPMIATNKSVESQKEIITNWQVAAAGHIDIKSAPRVISPWMIIADTDEKAEELARHHLQEQLRVSIEHYRIDQERHASIPGFEYLSDRMKDRESADAVRMFMESSFVGSSKTVARKMQALVDAGFDYFLVNTAMPGTSHALRRDWMRRFVEDVVPLVSEPVLQVDAA